jgi:hypothetical protein
MPRATGSAIPAGSSLAPSPVELAPQAIESRRRGWHATRHNRDAVSTLHPKTNHENTKNVKINAV